MSPREREFRALPPLAPTRRTRAARRSDPTYRYSPAWERVKVAVAVLLTVVGGIGFVWTLLALSAAFGG